MRPSLLSGANGSMVGESRMAALDHIKKCAGQRVIFGFEGTKIPSELIRLDEEWGIGGHILRSENFADFEQLMSLNEEFGHVGKVLPPFIGSSAGRSDPRSTRTIHNVSRHGAQARSVLFRWLRGWGRDRSGTHGDRL